MKIYVSAVVVLLLLSCNSESVRDYVVAPESKEMAFESNLEGERMKIEDVPQIPQMPGQPVPAKSSQTVADWNKQIIQNASINMRVKNFRTAHSGIYQAVENTGGYVAADSENQYGSNIQSNMTIKVPRDKFELLLSRITESGDSLLHKNITSDDVTAEYIDTRARIAAREKVRDKYYEFMQKAKNIDEVLKVQKEIGVMQEDIEAASGRVAYLKHQAAFSTIQLSFFQPLDLVIRESPEPPGFLKEAIGSLKEGWQFIEWVLIVLIKIWPLWVVGAVVGYFVKQRNRKVKLVSVSNKPM